MNIWLALLATVFTALGCGCLTPLSRPATREADAAVWGVAAVVAWLLAAVLWQVALPPS